MITLVSLVMIWYLVSLWKFFIEDSGNLFYACGVVIGTVTFVAALIVIMLKYLP
jgi:hypothetical protein